MSIEKLSFLLSAASLILAFLIVFAMPFWSPLAARVWYGPSFEAAATRALAELPKSESMCIFDDSLDIFVRSIDELNKARMLERAAQASSILWGTEKPIRKPHFRVFTSGKTYYWSFGEDRFVQFAGDRMSLLETGQQKCTTFLDDPISLRNFYKQRYGVDVSKDSFCCVALVDAA